MRQLLVVVTLVAFAGCDPRETPIGREDDGGGTVDGGPGTDSGFSQETYTYAGCEETHDLGGGCPRMLTLYCALDSIDETFSACAVDTDCVVASFEGHCSGYPRCPGPVVNKQEVEAFQEDFQHEIDRYCSEQGACIASEGHCQYAQSSYRPACVSGVCRAVVSDGGM